MRNCKLWWYMEWEDKKKYTIRVTWEIANYIWWYMEWEDK